MNDDRSPTMRELTDSELQAVGGSGFFSKVFSPKLRKILKKFLKSKKR